MALQLNVPVETYKEFPGSNLEQMPLLTAEGRVPMNVSQIMQQKLNCRNGPQEVKTAWMDNHFSTGDAIMYHPSGDIKIVLDSQYLRDINSQSRINQGALGVDKKVYRNSIGKTFNEFGGDFYRTSEGMIFKKREIGRVNTVLTKAEARAHPIWQFLARDKSLLADFTDLIFTEAEERFRYDSNMGICTSWCTGDSPVLRALCFNGLYSMSWLNGSARIDSSAGRLVGVLGGTK